MKKNPNIRYAVIHPDATVQPCLGILTLANMQHLVAGNIDVVACRGEAAPEGLHLVVNDDGLYTSLPINETAGDLYYDPAWGPGHRYGIRGSAIAIRISLGGENASLTDADFAAIDLASKVRNAFS